MSRQPFRAPLGGRIDRTRPLAFRFDGRRLEGFEGDTLASALLANGVRLAGRSFKYHRPRGLMGAGVEEPNVLVDVGVGARKTTNLRATEVELVEGLEARSINRWPSLDLDLAAVNDRLAAVLPAGFYYKTFMWPRWSLFEGPIRRIAGLGRPSNEPDPDRYETRSSHCEVLIIGSGPAGLAAARAASVGDDRVVVVEQSGAFGGSLLWSGARVDGLPGALWASETIQALGARPGVRLLSRATAIGYFDHNTLAIVERPINEAARERLWTIRARRVVLATGAIERPLVFPGNDRPGVMLASAAQIYARLYGVQAGRRAVVFTCNDAAYEAAKAVQEAGVAVAAVVDVRASAPPAQVADLKTRGVEIIPGGEIVETRGRRALKAACVRRADGRETVLDCDLLLMSGGWNPTVHLFSQSGGQLRFDEDKALFRPDASVQAAASVGGANGDLGLAAALTQGHAAGEAAIEVQDRSSPPQGDGVPEPKVQATWRIEGRGKAFVDFQNDVTVSDVALAARENYVSVEHLKRYTTLGMAVDQGKTSNVNAIAILGALTGRRPVEVGTTRFRPPFTPTSVAAFSGRQRGALYRPYRQTPVHAWHESHGATFEDFGGWFRPAVYRGPGEDHETAVRREALAARTSAVIFDASPLGKIHVKGPDAAAFLDRIYANGMASLREGRIRYGLMLNELGVIIDDGVCARLGADHFLVSTTSGGADRIAAWMEEWLQCEWTSLKVLIAPVTSDFGVVTLSGPRARDILQGLPLDIDLSAAGFPHMTFKAAHLGDVPLQISRVSFTGEPSFEITASADQTLGVWDTLTAAGVSFGLCPAGVDAWMRLRTEKGYLHVGTDTDGVTTPSDVGWGRVRGREADFIGKRSLSWAVNLREDRLQLVGLTPSPSDSPAPVGARLVAADGRDAGFVTSSGYSPSLHRGVALGLVPGGQGRLGETLNILGGGAVVVSALTAFDPAGARLHG